MSDQNSSSEDRSARTQSFAIVIMIIQAVVTLIIAPMAAWALTKVIDHGERIATIEASRFTSVDARTLENSLKDRLDVITASLARLPTEIPPDWFRAEVAGLMQKSQSMDSRLDRLERLMERILVTQGVTDIDSPE